MRPETVREGRIGDMLAHDASVTGACYSRAVRAFRTATALLASHRRVLLALLATSLFVAPAQARQPDKQASPAPAATPRPVSPEIADAFAVGRMLAMEGSLPESMAQLQRVAKAEPNDPYVQLELASVAMRMGRVEDAAAGARQALKLAPDDADAITEAVEILFSLGDADAALLAETRRALEHLVQLRPDGPEGLQMLSRVQLAQGDTAAAEKTMQQLVAAVPEATQTRQQLLRLLLQQGKKSEAAALLRDQLAADPDALDARTSLADLLSDLGDHAGAVSLLRAAPADQAASMDVQRRLAFELYRTGDSAGARALVEGMLKANPDTRLRLFHALLLEDQGETVQSAKELEALRREQPDDFEIGLSLGRVLAHGERRQEGLEILQQLADRIGDDPDQRSNAARARLQLAQFLAEDARWADVLTQLDKLGAPNDDFRAAATLLRVESLINLGRKEEALALLGPDAGLPPEALAAHRAEVLLGLGREEEAAAELAKVGTGAEGKARAAEVYQRAGQHARAIPLLRDLLAADPNANDVRFRLGAAYERAGQRGEAVATFQDLLKRAPDSAMTLNYLGYMWAEKGENLAEAERLVQRALALDPGNPAYLDSLGWVYFQMRQYPRAIDELQKAAKLLPADGTVQEHLGDALRAAGKLADARDAYQRALASMHDKDALPGVRKKLEEVERGLQP